MPHFQALVVVERLLCYVGQSRVYPLRPAGLHGLAEGRVVLMSKDAELYPCQPGLLSVA